MNLEAEKTALKHATERSQLIEEKTRRSAEQEYAEEPISQAKPKNTPKSNPEVERSNKNKPEDSRLNQEESSQKIKHVKNKLEEVFRRPEAKTRRNSDISQTEPKISLKKTETTDFD
jgi:hypothetical protein